MNPLSCCKECLEHQDTSLSATKNHIDCLEYLYRARSTWNPLTSWEYAVERYRKNGLGHIYSNFQYVIFPADRDLIAPYIKKWMELVDAAFANKQVPKDIKDIVYTLW
jgi:hypothetical protein